MLLQFSALSHPNIDPVMISIGPLAIHWYGVAYVIGILFGLWYAKKLVAANHIWGASGSPIKPEDIDDFLIWAVIGIIAGGRIGYILFYDFPTYIHAPLRIFEVWNGGMSFHGGLAGITIAMFMYARKHGFSPFSLFDVIAASGGIGFFLGRVANFINSELYGKISDVPWAVIFPGTDGLPRHPSQLYEGVLEGLLLFAILCVLAWKMGKLKYPGFLAGVFVIEYGISRILVEFVRVPDVQLGYFFGTGWVTMGMLLSLPIIAIGLWSVMTSKSRELN